MPVLWTDVISPADLTGYVRESLAAIEARKGTLARFLPNRDVADVSVRFRAGSTGLVPEAKFRAYDAEPDVAAPLEGKRVTIELPAVGQNIPVSEYGQLRIRNASDDAVRSKILETADAVTSAISDRVERLRGTVLQTGKATIADGKFSTDDDFGRDAGLTATAGTLWSGAGSDPLNDLATWVDLYIAKNGVGPGALVTSQRVLRQLAKHAAFQVVLNGGGTRPASISDVQAILAGYGLPEVVTYDRRTSAGRVVADDRLLLLPAPVETDDWMGTELGATFWGQTLTATDAAWGIKDAEQPGIVAGVYRNPKPPMIAEVISDAIALPVLANANLSAAFKVL